ncbi:MAG: uroporphyrinogen-III synthase [Meiothermus sp.]
MTEGANRPLRVALTHSEGRLEGLEELLRSHGFDPVRVPLVQTRTLQGVSLAPLQDCPWWLFTSAAAARAVGELGGSFQGHKLGAVGEATARALEKAGGRADLVSRESSGAGLAQAFLERGEAGPVGIPQGNLALPTLAHLLQEGGLEVRPLGVYTTVSKPWPQNLPIPDIVVLGSPSALQALPQTVAQTAQLIALGPSTARRLREMGLPHTTAPAANIRGVLKAAEAVRGELW